MFHVIPIILDRNLLANGGHLHLYNPNVHVARMSPALLMTEFEWRWNKLIAKQNKNLSDNIVVYIVKLAWQICRWRPTRPWGHTSGRHHWHILAQLSEAEASSGYYKRGKIASFFKINFLLLNVVKLNNLALIK